VALVDMGNLQLEILEDTSTDGFIARHTAAHGNAIHHFCLLSDDIETDLAALEQKGIPLMDRPAADGGARQADRLHLTGAAEGHTDRAVGALT
jgi:4-hydroxyphenylpyruvate dioxygenase-like putative hemolysin